MKKLTFFLFCTLCLHFSISAQSFIMPESVRSKFDTLLNGEERIFTKTEVEAEFPGGTAIWEEYFKNNFDPNILANQNMPKGIYKPIVWTVIDKTGKILLIVPETGYGYGIENEIVRILKESPDWIPAKQNSRSVRAYKRLTFTL